MATKKPEQSVVNERIYEDAPGEFPVIGFEPLEVPKGFKIVDLLQRIEALEAAVGKPSAKK